MALFMFGLKAWIKKELKNSADFWFTPEKPPTVKRGAAKTWRVVFTLEDGSRKNFGTVRALKWATAMEKARKIAKQSGFYKDIYRVQVKVQK